MPGEAARRELCRHGLQSTVLEVMEATTQLRCKDRSSAWPSQEFTLPFPHSLELYGVSENNTDWNDGSPTYPDLDTVSPITINMTHTNGQQQRPLTAIVVSRTV